MCRVAASGSAYDIGHPARVLARAVPRTGGTCVRNSWCCPPRPALQPGWRLWSSIHHGRAELELADAWPTPSAPGHKQYFPLKLLSFCPEGAPRGCARRRRLRRALELYPPVPYSQACLFAHAQQADCPEEARRPAPRRAQATTTWPRPGSAAVPNATASLITARVIRGDSSKVPKRHRPLAHAYAVGVTHHRSPSATSCAWLRPSSRHAWSRSPSARLSATSCSSFPGGRAPHCPASCCTRLTASIAT